MSSVHDRSAHAIHDTGPAAARRLRAAERLFYGGNAVFIAAAIFAGFWRSYLLRGLVDAPLHFPVPPSTPLVHVHGILFLGWVLLFMVQASLVSAGRRDLHRRLGPLAVAWVPLMVAAGVWTALASIARKTAPEFMDPRGFLAFQLGELVVFAVLAGAAVWARKDVQTHKRLMLIATLSLLPPAIARWPLPQEAYLGGMPVGFFLLADLALLPLLAWDLATRRRVHRATLWGGALLVLSLPLFVVVAGTPAWTAFAAGLVRLVS